MLNEMRMKNVFKIELRSSDRLSYEQITQYLKSANMNLRPVRGKFDTHWIADKVQIEVGVDCFYIGANGDLNAYTASGYIFDKIICNNFPFSNLRQIKTDINNEYNEDGVRGTITYYARDRRKGQSKYSS